MESFLTLPNILGVLSIMGVIFAIYKSYRDPQAKAEITDSVLTLRMDQLDKALANLKDNHLHTIEENVKANSREMVNIQIEVGKLSTIINERIPHKL